MYIIFLQSALSHLGGVTVTGLALPTLVLVAPYVNGMFAFLGAICAEGRLKQEWPRGQVWHLARLRRKVLARLHTGVAWNWISLPPSWACMVTEVPVMHARWLFSMVRASRTNRPDCCGSTWTPLLSPTVSMSNYRMKLVDDVNSTKLLTESANRERAYNTISSGIYQYRCRLRRVGLTGTQCC